VPQVDDGRAPELALRHLEEQLTILQGA
jgi:hypothetical protein